MELSNNVELEGISILDYCDKNISVEYYPNLKNIFPCFGYVSISKFSNKDTDENSKFECTFRSKIDDDILPCDTCMYFHAKLCPTEILCKNPLAISNFFAEWDDYQTPSIFKFDEYFTSGKRYRQNGDYKEITKMSESHNSLEFFEYQVFDNYESGRSGRYMRVYKNGEWLKLTNTEIWMKETQFSCGKYRDQSLENVYKNDLGYLQWVLEKVSDSPNFKEVVDVLLQMRKEGLL